MCCKPSGYFLEFSNEKINKKPESYNQPWQQSNESDNDVRQERNDDDQRDDEPLQYDSYLRKRQPSRWEEIRQQHHMKNTVQQSNKNSRPVEKERPLSSDSNTVCFSIKVDYKMY